MHRYTTVAHVGYRVSMASLVNIECFHFVVVTFQQDLYMSCAMYSYDWYCCV